MSITALLGLGLALGIRHATDADHVVAVTAIAARYKRVGPSVLVGALWGLGHTLTISIVGGIIVLFNLVVPPRVGLSLEFAVGILLTLIGAWNVAGKDGFVSAGLDGTRLPGLRAFLVGTVHGLAGSAAIALLVLSTVEGAKAGLLYILLFGLGTIVGMMIVTLSFASPVALLARRFAWSGARLRVATGVLSIAFGLYVMVQVGWVDGLFRETTTWNPH